MIANSAQIGQTAEYAKALAALNNLKAQLGITPELQAIARLLIVFNTAPVPQPLFPYVGDTADLRDRAVVEAWEHAWQRFIDGEDFSNESEY